MVNSVSVEGLQYESVAASQTAQPLGDNGAVGDILSHVTVTPSSLSPGVVTLLDGATSIPLFAGGTDSLLTLHPFTIPWGGRSKNGPFKITTGADLTVAAFGNFT